MTAGTPPMVDQRRNDQIRRRRVNSYWYRAGVPRRVRRDKTEELLSHLVEAVENGREIEDVVGDDLVAFASEWAQAERPSPLFDLVSQVVVVVTLLPGGIALLNPWLQGDDPRTGIPGGLLTYLAIIMPMFILWKLLRHRLNRQQAAILGVALFVVYAILFFLIMGWGQATDAFVAVPPATAWTLVFIGAASNGAAWWLKRGRQR